MKKISRFLVGVLVVVSCLPPVSVFASARPAGTNIVSGGTIYTITAENTRRPYTSAGAYLSYGFNSWENVVQASSEDLALPVGPFIPPRDGKIVCSDRGSDKGTCYLISNSKRAAFTAESVFKSLGFDFSKALYGDVSFLNSDANITSADEIHRSGVLINKAGTIFLVADGGLIGIPDMATLGSWGYSANDAVTSNGADGKLAQVSLLKGRANGELSPSNNTKSAQQAGTKDLCDNLAYEQHTIPYGMITDGKGFCYYPSDDKCWNMDGFQNSVPDGYFRDLNYNCALSTPTPTPVPTPFVDTGEIICQATILGSAKYKTEIYCKNSYSKTDVQIVSVKVDTSNAGALTVYDKNNFSTYPQLYGVVDLTLGTHLSAGTSNVYIGGFELSSSPGTLKSLTYTKNNQAFTVSFVWSGGFSKYLQM